MDSEESEERWQEKCLQETADRHSDRHQHHPARFPLEHAGRIPRTASIRESRVEPCKRAGQDQGGR